MRTFGAAVGFAVIAFVTQAISGGEADPAGQLRPDDAVLARPFTVKPVTIVHRSTSERAADQPGGPLRVLPANPRYFTDGSGRAIYLTGTHTWNNFQDTTEPGAAKAFDFHRYLDFLSSNHHNFIRMWTWEAPRWGPWTKEDLSWFPMPYERSATPGAGDGGNKFDLNRFNQAYFDRLKDRVSTALSRRIYVSVMLFNGGSIGNRKWPDRAHKNPWNSHPFRKTNNINGIDGDPNADNQGWETHTWPPPQGIWAYQEAYIRKVVDTVNDLDNVLYEVTNEDPDSTMRDWNYRVIEAVHQYEATKPKRHPVGMSQLWADSAMLWESPADWIAPGLDKNDPLAADGRKVVIVDSDHIEPGLPASTDLVWKCYLRGHSLISMEHGGEGIAPIFGNDFRSSRGDIATRLTRGDTRIRSTWPR